ncbi:hypothetical protein AC249_AIPGENE22231 [Exaiptasia diaphana]|nr:hypothetical protein AC249_AIPGENE22231 [Exaiptasia diaphana]
MGSISNHVPAIITLLPMFVEEAHSFAMITHSMKVAKSVCAKDQAGYTPESGVIKPLSLGHMALLKKSQAKRLIETTKLSVIPCALANDGTALKPAIEFDPRLKENIGLTKPVDLSYIQENPTPEYLKNNIVTEAIVSSLTSLDNFCSLPVAVDYTTKSGKTAETMYTLFEQQIKTLQTCESCQQRSPDNRHIFSFVDTNCSSFCEECYESQSVCNECKLKGQCKQETFKETIESGTVDPELALLSILPVCPHVGKSMKAAFSNWWLTCEGERINLALLRTLRNRSSKETKGLFRKLIPKNDHVKNKDRQDPSSVLTLSSPKLTDELKQVGYTIIPELDKYSPDNQLCMYPSPISIATPSFGWLIFLSFDVKSSTSTLYKARLHSPVDRITPIVRNLPSTDIHCADGVIYLTSYAGGPIKAIPFHEKAINILSSLKKKDDLINAANLVRVSSSGTVAEIKERLNRYTMSLKASYERNGIQADEVHFWDIEEPSVNLLIMT